MKKYDYIEQLAKDTARQITKNEEAWKTYLDTAARLYRYSFSEQMLIYAQRPDATACASIETWNQKMHCWVNRGAKGIALLEEGDDARLKYVFDVSDVHKAARIGRDPNLWVMEEVHKETILKQLEKIYGETEKGYTFEEKLIETAGRIAQDCCEELTSEMAYAMENSFLEPLDQQNRNIRIRETLASSIAYTLLSRCGADTEAYQAELRFDYIHDFSTMEALSVVGCAVTELSKPVLMEIGKSIKRYSSAVPERKKGLEIVSNIDYNTLKRRSEQPQGEKEKSFRDEEREGVYEQSDIRGERGLFDSESETEPGTRGRTEEVREDAGNLSEGEPQRNLYGASSKWEVKEPSSADTGTSRGADGVSGEPDAENRRRDGGTESTKSDALGAENEPYHTVGGGKRADRTDLQLNTETGEPDSAELPGFSVVGLEREILCHSRFLLHTKSEIAGYLLSETEKSRQTDYVKSCYREEEYTEFLVGADHQRGGYRADADGISIWQGAYVSRTGQARLTWEEVRGRINAYLREGTYLAEGEIPMQMAKAGNYQQISLFPSLEEQAGNIAAAEAGRNHMVPAGFSISDKQIDAILRTGGGRDNSRKRIYAKYQQGKTPVEMTQFLKQDYASTGKGFMFDGEPVAVWFDAEGMKLGHGKSARQMPLNTLNWAQAEQRVRTMIEQGTYMSDKEAFLVDEGERSRIAGHLYFFFRDGMEETPEELNINGWNFPDSHTRLTSMLSDREGIDTIAACMDTAMQQLESGEKKMGFRSVVSPKELREELKNLRLDKLEFPLPDTVEVRKEDFITQDEIDAKIIGGSTIHNGKLRIYEYFKEQHSKKENIAFLKREYGTGGSTHALAGSDNSYEDHSAKGIKLQKGNICNPYTEILLSWTVVEKRIRELVDLLLYLPEENMEAYSQQQRGEKQKAREQEESTNPGSPVTETVSYMQPLSNDEESEHSVEPEPPILDSKPYEKHTAVPEMPAEKEPEIDQTDAVNFCITKREEPSQKGFAPKEKYHQNVAAIRTLECIEEEHRTATPKEQVVLSKYVGWGGLADAFDDKKANWANEYQELKNLLSPEEYDSARSSTLNAHYTSPVIIQNIYYAMEQMGFVKGNILEPAMGTGNFFGMLPEKMKDSRLYGVELDGITGRIAKQLYPHADIQITGFENTTFPNDFFDAAVGNVPFGQYKVADRAYDKQNFLIHDYFFAKTLDKVRPGGIVAFVTSKGTMDKQSPAVRKYLAQRAELLGAVRLPNNAFKENAGTGVTSDILFLKKRDRMIASEPDWVHLAENEDGIAMNDYFVQHPEMILGKMELVSGPYGMEATCTPDPFTSLAEQLQKAVSRMEGSMDEVELEEPDDELAEKSIPADPAVTNYSYTVVNDQVYYRENSRMRPVQLPDTMEQRVKGLAEIRNCTQELIAFQLEEYPERMIQNKQTELNACYDAFSKKFGLINSRTNKQAFHEDSSYCLLCSLEKLDDAGNFTGKADMFTKRTIKKHVAVTSVDTASEALAVSLSEKAEVDVPYMAELAGKSEAEITTELAGVIFLNPVTGRWENADEYLSGNVREKLITANVYAENHLEYAINVSALKKVQPKELDASEIEVRIGATWMEPHYMDDFMRDIFQTPDYLFQRNIVGIEYSKVTGQWNVKGKNADRGNALVNMTYGTGRANAYKILEDSLNLRDSRIFDLVMEDGIEKRVLNKKETMLASQKQESIRESFQNWVFRDPQRRQTLCQNYNELFNSTRPREYDGSHLKFPGMTPDIILEPHQANAVAHVLYGANTLLAHCVGAGKTFEMTAAAMESRRLGLCQKSLFVVPNHLTQQWAGDFLRLYPGANILAATKKDFEPANRKKFCSRIATGDYDAVIIGHSQFEKIPLSAERQTAIVERQIEEIEMAIEAVKEAKGERYPIKQMEKTKKSLAARLSRLNDDTRKDSVVTFEQLGVDRLFVDESHNYKNLFLYTKMRNVAGIAQTEAKKSSDMFGKCQYLDEVTGGKGITFATGTPISNSMTELYTNMRYLQYNTLQRMGLGHFDSWAASFGETQTAIELAPEGTGYRAKTRFAKFFNLPELIALFKESADIQTPDMLKLPVPEAEYINVVLKPSEYQKDIVSSLAERAEKVRDRKVEPYVDNMLKITNDGRKLALDQRLMDPLLPGNENSKSNACVEKAFDIWKDTTEIKAAQLIFCDLSTPQGKGVLGKLVDKVQGLFAKEEEKADTEALFTNVYHDIRKKLIEKGVPSEEIDFIHNANTETQKAELFAKVRSGQVRFLLGSTAKMGAGTNIQDLLIAEHHLDVPWRPSDIEQREGRIIRKGNQNKSVKIFRYVTEGTFDSYSWQLIENKQKFIGQIMTSKSPVRSCEDIDEAALTYAEVKALATGNPNIKEKMDLDIQVSRLKFLKAEHTSQIYRLEDDIAKNYPQQMTAIKERIAGYQEDIQTYQQKKPRDKDAFSMKIANKVYSDKKEAGTALTVMCREVKKSGIAVSIGAYQGFEMSIRFDSFFSKFTVTLKGQLSHEVEIGTDVLGNIQRLNNALDAMNSKLSTVEQKLDNVKRQFETAKAEVTKPFEKEQELAEKQERLSALNGLLSMEETDGTCLIEQEEQEMESSGLSRKTQEIRGPKL